VIAALERLMRPEKNGTTAERGHEHALDVSIDQNPSRRGSLRSADLPMPPLLRTQEKGIAGNDPRGNHRQESSEEANHSVQLPFIEPRDDWTIFEKITGGARSPRAGARCEGCVLLDLSPAPDSVDRRKCSLLKAMGYLAVFRGGQRPVTKWRLPSVSAGWKGPLLAPADSVITKTVVARTVKSGEVLRPRPHQTRAISLKRATKSWHRTCRDGE
jgi:hypothetical protein